MYMGMCVEYSEAKELFRSPLHPYTRALLSAIPVPSVEMQGRRPQIVKGEVSNPINPAPGCRFAPRCPMATERCTGADIPLTEVSPGHTVACLQV